MLQDNEVVHSDIRMQPLTSDEDRECKVAAAGPCAVEELSNEVTESTSQPVDVINLPSETVASPADDDEHLAPCDKDETLLSEQKSEGVENLAAAEDQRGSEVVCDETFITADDDDERHKRLDDTVTNVVVSEDVIVGRATVNSVSSDIERRLETNSVDETAVCDSDMPVKDDQTRPADTVSEPADTVSNVANSDSLSSPQIDSVGNDVSECRQLQDEDNASNDLHVLPDDSVTVNTDRENGATPGESGGLLLVEDVGTHPSCCTEAQLVGIGDIVATGHADLASDKAVDEMAEITPQSDQPCTTPESEMAESKKLADGIPESVMGEPEKLADGLPTDGIPESEMAESKKLVDGLPTDGMPESEIAESKKLVDGLPTDGCLLYTSPSPRD